MCLHQPWLVERYRELNLFSESIRLLNVNLRGFVDCTVDCAGLFAPVAPNILPVALVPKIEGWAGCCWVA